MRPWTNRTAYIGIAGACALVIGLLKCLSATYIFEYIIRTELVLTPDSRGYQLWQNSSTMPVYLNFHFFNWTNPEDIRKPGVKPKFVEVGPYSFREIREKVNVTFHPENNTVSYLQRRFWHFDESKSKGLLTDNITHLNVVAVSAVNVAQKMAPMMQQSLGIIMASTNSKIYVKKSVDELLFKGYKDSLIDIGRIAAEEDNTPPFDQFGWFYKRNGSTFFDGHNNMGTGLDDLNNLGVLKFWNHSDTVKYYKSPCNAIEGSAGEFWPPFRNKDDIKLYVADICRPLTYEFVEEVTHKDIKGYKFAVGKKTLSNDTLRRYPHEQAKYFEPTTTTEDFYNIDPATTKPKPSSQDPDVVNVGNCFCNGKCSPRGVINITACRYNAPAFISLPHFYKADPVLLDQVEGLNPVDEKHDFYITLEPNTGIPIDVAARLQVNMLIKPSNAIPIFKDVPTMYFPVFYFSLHAGIPDDMAASLTYLLMLPDIIFYAGLVLIFVGTLAILSSAILCYMHNRNQNNKRFKARNIEVEFNATDKKTEVVYVDKTMNDDAQVKGSRHLYPTS